MASASDVPGKYDVVINGQGYVLWDSLQPNLPFRTQRALYSFSPTFLERTNISGTYGDNQQDFFLTASQNDWSEGKGQRFFRGGDPDKSRRYYTGNGIDTTTIPGQIICRPGLSTLNPGTLQGAACAAGKTIGINLHCYASNDAGTQNLHTVDQSATDTNKGAHGSGAPNQWGMCNDGVNVYIAGATRITKWTGSAFSSFSATANAGSLAYLNNALYSCDGSTLNTYDGTGTKTTVFTWKDATNTALPTQAAKLITFGGKLLIYFPYLYEGPELWIYDGIAPSRLAVLPDSMLGYDCDVLEGIVFMSGLIYGTIDGVNMGSIPAVYYYANGNIGELWRGDTLATSSGPTVGSPYMPALGNFSGKLYFTDLAAVSLYEYDPTTGAITGTSGWTHGGTATSTLPWISCTPSSVLVVANGGGTFGEQLLSGPNSSIAQSDIRIRSSQFDFDNSLKKVFRSIRIDWEGSGSVDIYYGVDGVSSATLLQASAVSGAEYLLPDNTIGSTIYYQLNITVSSGSPIVKRVYLRAGPQLQSFKLREYILDLTGAPPDNPRFLRDGSPDPTIPHDAVANLITAASSSTPISITDRFGTFTGIIEPDKSEILEMHAQNEQLSKSGAFVAKIAVREV